MYIYIYIYNHTKTHNWSNADKLSNLFILWETFCIYMIRLYKRDFLLFYIFFFYFYFKTLLSACIYKKRWEKEGRGGLLSRNKLGLGKDKIEKEKAKRNWLIDICCKTMQEPRRLCWSHTHTKAITPRNSAFYD